MPPAGESSEVDPLDVVAEEIAHRFRSGERPTSSEYALRFPALAERIRALFPALVAMEEIGAAVEQGAGTAAVGPAVPERVGEFRILRKIGEGGMGVVYEARQESLGRHVALKVLQSRQDVRYLERFRREARTAARLHHTHIVPIFAVGDVGDVHFYAMQLIHGQGLDAVLREVRSLRDPGGSSGRAPRPDSIAGTVARSLAHGEFEPVTQGGPQPDGPAAPGSTATDLARGSERRYYREVARLGAQTAEALAFAHAQGVIHRDVKPSNLLLDTHGTLWIADFGLAKADDSDNLTHTGDMVGTLRYMAPERFRGRCDARSDLYSLGATLYEMLALRPVFDGDDRLSLVERIGREVPPCPRRYDPRIPRDLETIVLKAMAREPAERYRSAADLADDLQRFLGNRPIQARRTSLAEELWRWGRRNPIMATLAISVLLLLAILATGAPLVALRMGRARDEAVKLGAQARQAERERSRQLAQSLLDQARASRLSRRPGQRFETLETILRASRLGKETGAPVSFFSELRSQAIACLALPDVHLGPLPARGGAAPWPVFAATLDIYAALDLERRLRVARLDDDRELARLVTYPGGSTVRLSGGIPVVAVRSETGGFRAWDLRRGGTGTVHDEPSHVRGHDVRRDGAELALGFDDRTIALVDLVEGRERRRFTVRRAPIDLVYAPDGLRLAVSGRDGVEILDIRSGRVVADLPQPGPVFSTAWDPEGRALAVACNNAQILVWEAATSRCVHRLSARSNGVRLTYAPDGGLLLGAGWDGVLRMWEPRGGQLRLAVQDAATITFTNGGHLLVNEHIGRPPTRIEVATGREFRTLERPSRIDQEIMAVAAHPGGRLLAGAFRKGVGLWDTDTGRLLSELPVSGYRLAFDAGGDLLVHGQEGLFRWPVRAGQGDHWVAGPPTRIDAPKPDVIMAVACSRDGQVIAGTFEDRVGVLRADAPGRTTWLGPQSDVRELAVSPDGRWVAAGSWNSIEGAIVYDAATGRQEVRFPVGACVSVSFSPDDHYLVIGSGPGAQRVVRVGDWDQVAEFPGLAVAFTGDGRLMAVAGTDGAVQLIEPETGREQARLEPPELDRAYRLAFTPDGSRLAVACSPEKPVDVWNLALIRRQLAGIGLDWEAPPTVEAPSGPIESLQVIGASHVAPPAEFLAK
jgi:serine/threonine protein kinase/WD40 repeat protein